MRESERFERLVSRAQSREELKRIAERGPAIRNLGVGPYERLAEVLDHGVTLQPQKASELAIFAALKSRGLL